ncbi:response regulator transcription factor [Paraburkholderia guartelaensis]|jgi:DNA-binding NarL/FixJ family response regulator|uniref:Response regulator transcription factor n=1 Tax=Paraburkholderia guartelaensis TaxID=2546446 RepID=A0A4R5LKZ1_9BURK|nr:response regulator transcription factor [Paraburkholderia guartelaensis]TDG10316.1 response regulator transcription factor [Paraburkholderia guartelaensis]
MSDGTMEYMGPVRVAIIAASPQVRASLQAIVEAEPALAFLGSAADAETLAGTAPDVVVADNEPEASDALKTLFEPGRAPPALVLLLDDADSDGFLEELPAEATAILSRNVMPAEIVAAIEAAAAGLCVLSPDILARLLAGRKPLRQTASGGPFEALSIREIEVLAMLADGLGNKEIARQLDISDNTVKSHLSSIFGKLGATNRTEAVMLGMRHGYIMV